MNGILFAAASLGALATMMLAEPNGLAQRDIEAPPAQRPEESAAFTSLRAPVPAPAARAKQADEDARKDKGSMTTKTVVDVDRDGEQTVTTERVIAFED